MLDQVVSYFAQGAGRDKLVALLGADNGLDDDLTVQTHGRRAGTFDLFEQSDVRAVVDFQSGFFLAGFGSCVDDGCVTRAAA